MQVPSRGQPNWDQALNAVLVELDQDITGHEVLADAHGLRSWADSRFARQPASLDAFLADSEFWIAHRGSGGEFPEHTMAAYSGVTAAGARAIEVSVQTTADGVPVCMHDATLDRTTNATGPVASYTYAQLRETVQVTVGSGLLGPGWTPQPIPTLREVLDRFWGKVVIFLEPKSNASVPLVQDLITTHYPDSARSIVWKGYYLSNSFAWARSNGFRTWGYVDAATTDAQMDAVDANIDMWGVPVAMTDARMAAVVARGKPVICWEVHRTVDYQRLNSLGVRGMMAAQWIYLNQTLALTSAPSVAEIAPPGTLGVARYDPVYAPKFDGAGGLYVNVGPNQSLLMGGHRAPADSGYRISWRMKWPVLPTSTLHSGIAFCRQTDDVYQFSNANDDDGDFSSPGGYHVVMRAGGDMQLYSHVKGSTTGTQLGTVTTDAPVADTYMTFETDVTPTQVILRRTDVGPYAVTADNTTYRGRYWHLSTGSVATAAQLPHFEITDVELLP
ncbi:glycerophosphodiester phosphodiesterase [Streptomyces sp. MP131-18]|uniref:glycerophosphodiester phosphodiesterase n=1 Tax=Streptomyces sp. MP131-18 TaxID=1857892 RepID=UPI00097CB3C6|nr:glycerophosphodiester phosphodiesterase [Streptomyces sp. MP131-18]ONK10375.1 putative glycerophosphoryl diester phosphodiesterase 1 [Streptomyces sp. MP131-18]